MAELTPKVITELPELTSIPDTAAFAVSSGGSSRRTLWSTIKSAVFASLTAASNYTINGVTFVFRKYGRVVVCTTIGSLTSPTSTSSSMGSATVDDAIKPLSTEIRYILVTPTDSIQFNLATDGTFSVGYSSAVIPAGTTLRGTFVYISAS